MPSNEMKRETKSERKSSTFGERKKHTSFQCQSHPSLHLKPLNNKFQRKFNNIERIERWTQMWSK
jgi:hypothetical protein